MFGGTMRVLALSIALLASIAPPASAIVAVDASSRSSNAFGTSLMWSHTVGFESNRLLLVGVSRAIRDLQQRHIQGHRADARRPATGR
jgi:hypothetical protein